MAFLGGVVGGGLNLGGIFEPIRNLTDSVLLELARFAVGEHCKRLGLNLRLVGLADASVQVGPNGKTYELKLKVEAQVANVWVVKLAVARLFVPFIGLPSLLSFEYSEEIGI